MRLLCVDDEMFVIQNLNVSYELHFFFSEKIRCSRQQARLPIFLHNMADKFVRFYRYQLAIHN